MLALVRKKREIPFPARAEAVLQGCQAVYSLENVRYPQADGSVCGAAGGEVRSKLDCGGGLGAASTHNDRGFRVRRGIAR